jgi:hypothetical protein
LLVCERSARKAEVAVADIELALSVRDVSVDVVIGDDALQAIEHLYDCAQGGNRPLLLLSTGNSAKISQACRAMSAIGNVPYFDIDGSNFPLALWDDHGNLQIFYDYYDLIDNIVSRLESGASICQTDHAPDAGWSRLRMRLERGTASNGLVGTDRLLGGLALIKRGNPRSCSSNV